MEHRTHNRNEIVFWQSSRYGEKHVLLSLFRYQEIKTHAIVRTDQIPPAKPKVKHRCDLHFICIHDTRDNSHFWGTPHTLPGYLFDRWKKSACPEGGSPACQAGIQREQPVTPEFKINFLKRKRRFCGICAFWKDVAREADGLRKRQLTCQSAASPAVPKLGFYCHRTHLLSQSIKGWTRSVIEIWIYSSLSLPIGLTFSKILECHHRNTRTIQQNDLPIGLTAFWLMEGVATGLPDQMKLRFHCHRTHRFRSDSRISYRYYRYVLAVL